MLQLTPFLNTFAQTKTGEFESSELAMIAIVPLVLAIVIFFIGIKLHHAGKPIWLKWIAFVPLAIGLILGISPTQKFWSDQLYRDFYGGGNKKGLMHAGGVIMPIIGTQLFKMK